MEATSITRTKDMIIALIKQALSEKIEQTGVQIEEFLMKGAVHSAAETIRELSSWFEDPVREAYLSSLCQCAIILSWLRTPGAEKGLRPVSYRTVRVTLPTGTGIQIRSPFFVKASPERGRKKRGPQKRGEHLLLPVMGFVHKVGRQPAFRAVQSAVLSPSFAAASEILNQEGIKLGADQIRRLVAETGNSNLSFRVERLLKDGEECLFKGRRILIGVDGGRLRQRRNKRGRRPVGYKRCGFHTDRIGPELFTLHVIDEEGSIVKDTAPFVDGTTGKLKEFTDLPEHYLICPGIDKASEVVPVGDGAPWIWERIPKLIRSVGGDELKLTEIIDWTHAKQNLNKAFETLSKKKRRKVDFNRFKNLLFSGRINEMAAEIKTLLNVGASSRIMKKLKSCFISNTERMQYENILSDRQSRRTLLTAGFRNETSEYQPCPVSSPFNPFPQIRYVFG